MLSAGNAGTGSWLSWQWLPQRKRRGKSARRPRMAPRPGWRQLLLMGIAWLRCGTAALQVVVAENHGVMFCHECEDPMHQGSYVAALPGFHSPSGYFVTAELVYAVPNRGETPLLNVDEVRGRVALLDRGKVPFALKVQRAQEAGALGVILVDSAGCANPTEPCFEDQFALVASSAGGVTTAAVTVFGGDPLVAWRDVRIPAVLISAADGERVKSFMALETFELEGETHFTNQL